MLYINERQHTLSPSWIFSYVLRTNMQLSCDRAFWIYG